MRHEPVQRDPAERIEELLKANEGYRDRAIKAEQRAVGEAYRSAFWMAHYERVEEEKAELKREVERLELRLAGMQPSLFDVMA